MKKFKRIFIEISNVCNLSCSFCPPSLRAESTLSTNAFESILQKIQGHGDNILLHVKGEPLNHPHFADLLKLCDAYKKRVSITTNGTLLKKQGQSILESPSVRLVNVSLQSFENTQNRDVYLKYLDMVLEFVRNGLNRTEKIFELRIWNLENLDGSVIHENAWILDYIKNSLGNHVPITGQNSKGVKVKSRIYLSRGHEFEWPSLGNDFVGTSGTCHGLRRQIAILSDGTVVPCCLDADGIISLGNIFESDFESIVTSPRADKIARGFENNKIVEQLCTKCSYRKCFVESRVKMPKNRSM